MSRHAIQLAPSILAADFLCLGQQVAEAEAAGASRIHVDVMDGRFVPNLSLGTPIVASLRKGTRLPLEVHLMIEAPERFLDAFAEAGADAFLVHWEGAADLSRTLRHARRIGKRVGVALNPATPASALEEVWDEIDQVTVMTVNPGFGHQAFLEFTLPKIQRLREAIDRRGLACDLEVDGGVDESTAPRVVAAGANVLVAGSAIFGSPLGVTAAMRRLAESVA